MKQATMLQVEARQSVSADQRGASSTLVSSSGGYHDSMDSKHISLQVGTGGLAETSK
jgi:hypothetical protein